MNDADSNHWSATASSVPPSSDTAPGVPTAAAQPEAAASARDEVVDGLTEHACCFSEEDAKRMVDAHRDEVALEIGRDALRDGLVPTLNRLVGEANARKLLADFLDQVDQMKHTQ